MRICQLNIFLSFSYGGHFVHLSRTVGAILVEDIMMNHFCEIMLNLEQSGMVCAIFVEYDMSPTFL